jgi:hypothetical protein
MPKQVVNKDNIVIPPGTMEDFKRPNHPDFMTSGELKAASFSGMRVNSVSGDMELWVLGEIRKTVSTVAVSLDPQAINKAMEEVFALNEVQPDIADLKRFRKATGQ